MKSSRSSYLSPPPHSARAALTKAFALPPLRAAVPAPIANYLTRSVAVAAACQLEMVKAIFWSQTATDGSNRHHLLGMQLGSWACSQCSSPHKGAFNHWQRQQAPAPACTVPAGGSADSSSSPELLASSTESSSESEPLIGNAAAAPCLSADCSSAAPACWSRAWSRAVRRTACSSTRAVSWVFSRSAANLTAVCVGMACQAPRLERVQSHQLVWCT